MSAEADEARATVAIVADASDLTRRRLAVIHLWTDELEKLLDLILEPTTPDRIAALSIADYVRSRLADLTTELKIPGEMVRASVWIMSGDDQRLHFVLGSEIDNPDKQFRSGEGIIGRAYASGQIWNVPNGPARPEYAQAERNPPFSGLLVMPLNKGAAAPFGVLCIDRTTAETFPESAVDTAGALAKLIVIAMTSRKPTR